MAGIRKLLTEREYNRVVKKGPEAMAEALREFVAKPGGRPSIADRPLTKTEIQRRWREKKRESGEHARKG
jgi:hypothetical protein